MKDFFMVTGGMGYEMFGSLHITLIIVTIIAIMTLVAFSNRLKKWKHKEKIRFISAFILTLNMLIYYISLIITKQMNYVTDLPIHLCFITNFLMIYILLTGNKKWYQVVYFFTFIGPLPAMIWSDLACSYDRYVFYQFIISHHIMFLTSLYLLLVLEYKTQKKYILHAIFYVGLYAVLMMIVNHYAGSNYLMLTSLPDTVIQLYPFTTSMPAGFWLAIVGMLSIMISYLPAYFINKKQVIVKNN